MAEFRTARIAAVSSEKPARSAASSYLRLSAQSKLAPPVPPRPLVLIVHLA